jgi:hypothetical protein
LRARTIRESLVALLDGLRPIVACVTDRPLFASRVTATSDRYGVAFRPIDRPAFIALGARQRLLLLVDLQIDVKVGPSGDVSTQIAAYHYHVLDRDEREIIAFHWHPEGVSPIRFPHLHLSSTIGRVPLPGGSSVDLAGMHLPTGSIALADVVRLLIVEFRAVPRRDDWEAILNRPQHLLLTDLS